MSTMHTSPDGIALIKMFEGLRLKAYKDAIGIPTIGFGTTVVDGQPVKMGTTITEERAEDYLKIDLRRFEDGVRFAVSAPLTQRQYDALVSFSYNLGVGNLKKSTLLRLINAGKYEEAQVQFLRWNRAGGKVLRGLTRRRLDEAVLFGGPMSREEMIESFNLVI